MTCGVSCQYSGRHTDAAKRISDAAMMAWTVYGWDSVRKWMSFKLEDGRTDHGLYPSKRDAVRHVPNELAYAFICLHPGGMGLCEAEIMLQFTRKAVKAGFRLADPDSPHGGRDVIPRISTEKIHAQLRALTRGNN